MLISFFCSIVMEMKNTLISRFKIKSTTNIQISLLFNTFLQKKKKGNQSSLEKWLILGLEQGN